MRRSISAALLVVLAAGAALMAGAARAADSSSTATPGGAASSSPAASTNAATTASRSADSAARPPATAKPAELRILDVQRVDKIAAGLKGQAAAMPFGDPVHGLRAFLYVPSNYCPGRPWPLLVDGTDKGLGDGEFRNLARHAEQLQHLLLLVEYLYVRGPSSGAQRGWTREGERDFEKLNRPAEEILADMAIDEMNLLSLVKETRRLYSVDPQAIGITGFLFNGTMAYRQLLAHPEIFCCAIARTANFWEGYMPPVTKTILAKPVYIIYGEKEPEWILDDAERAISFFKANRFTNLNVERIPNSGVDSRVEIAANYFQGLVQKILGPGQLELYGLQARVWYCLQGQAPPAPAAAADATAAAGDATASDAAAAAPGAPESPEVLLKALQVFEDAQTSKIDLRAQAEFLSAQLIFEKLGDRRKADEMLRQFLRPPLKDSPTAIPATYYLAEKVIDRQANAAEAVRVLGYILARPNLPPAEAARVNKLRKEINQKPPAGGAAKPADGPTKAEPPAR